MTGKRDGEQATKKVEKKRQNVDVALVKRGENHRRKKGMEKISRKETSQVVAWGSGKVMVNKSQNY